MTREEAIRKLQKQKAEYLEEWVDYSGVAEAYDMAIKALEEQPIRCKDCKHYRALHDQDDLCVYTMTSVEADDYCSYAERKEGEAE